MSERPDSTPRIVMGRKSMSPVSRLVFSCGPSPRTVAKSDKGAQSQRHTSTKGSGTKADAVKMIAVILVLASILLGVANILTFQEDNDSVTKILWPQGIESQPFQLWDEAWEAMELWAKVTEPLLPPAPDETPQNTNNIYATFHSLSKSYGMIGELCSQLSFISSARSADTSSAIRVTMTSVCDTAEKALRDFNTDWAHLISYSSRIWLQHPIGKLYSAAYNTSLFQYDKQQEEQSESPAATEARGSSPGIAGNATPIRQSPFNNQTALHLLDIASPSFPKLRPVAADMTGRLRSLQTLARVTAESIVAVSELVPQELRGHQDDEKPDVTSPFAKQWTNFEFNSWWTGGKKAAKFSAAVTRRAAKNLAKLYEVIKAFDPPVAESVRRAETVEARLDWLARKVTALVDPPKKEKGGLDGAWSELGWRADCGCDERQAGSNIRAVATPVVVEYFVPSTEELVQGMEGTCGMLVRRKVEEARRRGGAVTERKKARQGSWDEFSREYGEGMVGDEDGCAEMSVDGNGKRKCLTADEIMSSVRGGADSGVNLDLGRIPSLV